MTVESPDKQTATPPGESVAVKFVPFEGPWTQGSVEVVRFSPAERNARASKFFFIFFGLAFVSAILPPHWLWFLLLLTVAFVGSYFKRQQDLLVVAGEGVCPNCNKPEKISKGASEVPFIHYCSQCKRRIDVESLV